jgi:hypothetical protein
MNQKKIIEQIQLALKEAYHKAVDADKLLNAQKELGNGKYSQIFSSDGPFRTQADTFLPYIEELASDLVLLQESEDDDHFVSQLQTLVSKLNLVLTTLQQLKTELN